MKKTNTLFVFLLIMSLACVSCTSKQNSITEVPTSFTVEINPVESTSISETFEIETSETASPNNLKTLYQEDETEVGTDPELEVIYQKALMLMDNGDYEDAEIAFREIRSYRDSYEKERECLDKNNEKLYQKAIALFESDDYDAAMELFGNFPLSYYKDSTVYYQKCVDAKKDKLYCEAIDLYNLDEKEEAYKIFTELKSYKESPGYCRKIIRERINSVELYSRIVLGQYNHQEISWIVLAKENGRVLLLAEKPLFSSPFYDESQANSDYSWENSNIRKELNKKFIASAFAPEEADMLISVPVIQDHGKYTEPLALGNDTADKVFILSLSELKQFFPDDYWELSYSTSWIRTHGFTSKTWMRFNDNMLDCFYSYYSRGSRSGVRPAVWLDLYDVEETQEDTKLIGNRWNPPGMQLSESAVYNRIIKKSNAYPAGSYWGYDSYYQLQAPAYGDSRTYYTDPIYACIGFALLLSDSAFSGMEINYFSELTHFEYDNSSLNQWRKQKHTISFDALKVGDILSTENFDGMGTTHASVVIEKHDDYLYIAEGNANAATNYWRQITKKEFDDSAFEIITRYPILTHPHDAECKSGEWAYFGSTSNSHPDAVVWLVSDDQGTTWYEVLHSRQIWESNSALNVFTKPEYNGYMFRCAYTYPGGWYLLSEPATLYVQGE